jgi:hypothetical protein
MDRMLLPDIPTTSEMFYALVGASLGYRSQIVRGILRPLFGTLFAFHAFTRTRFTLSRDDTRVSVPTILYTPSVFVFCFSSIYDRTRLVPRHAPEREMA